MDKEKIETMIILYNQLFDDYTRKMMWLTNKKEFSQAKKFVISKNITEKSFIELLRIQEHLKDVCGLLNAFDRKIRKH